MLSHTAGGPDCGCRLRCVLLEALRLERIELGEGAYLWLLQAFVPAEEATQVEQRLVDELPWAQRILRMFGRDVLEPRLVAYLGEPGAVYTYSRRRNAPDPWTPCAQRMRERVMERVGVGFNAVLANLYRDGRDSMGAHADDEPELGPLPIIASLSFGARRRFLLRARRGTARHEVWLEHGSLLVMGGTTQQAFAHSLPKQREACERRINLTFRCIYAAAPGLSST
jgi:alkylated DNA repair dioxygenase AlkB